MTESTLNRTTVPVLPADPTASDLDEIALSLGEYAQILARLGRRPSEVELGMFGAMWSEHCGYKNSKPLLKLFPTTGPRVLQGPGENAGAVDVGNGLAVVMKMESHNHPSAVEPVEGAATGVGGIIRDIFTMGARPIAVLDSLRFGPIDRPRNRFLFEGVVNGIQRYGNCIGVPTVGGEVYFADSYSGNPLVNVMAVGVIESRKLIRSIAQGVGNTIMLVGADTGRDGIHGCSGLASRELSDENEEQRPTVQVGNPFLEKLLIEACLELSETDHIVAMQDLGAAGITSSLVEVASKGSVGVEIDIDRVSRRESGMTPYEVMLSESQERMLIVVRRGREDAVKAIFDRWGLHSDIVGRVTADGRVRVLDAGQVVADAPAEVWADPPVYRRQGIRPAYLDRVQAYNTDNLKPVLTPGDSLLKLLAFPDIASKHSVYRQYDYSVQTNTIIGPGDGDAAVLRLKGTNKAIAVATDCNGRYCYLDPRLGAQIAIAESARNVVCAGGEPIAVTDCLNYGNPEKLEIYYQLEEGVRGMADACRALGVPVISGNVSLYNETNGEAIYPTPTVGMLGLLEDLGHARGMAWRQGDVVALLGNNAEQSLGGTAYLEAVHGVVAGRPPALDLDVERAVQATCLEGIRQGVIRAAHDCADGGLAVTLAECAIKGGVGLAVGRAEIDACAGELPARAERWLFNEAQSRIVVSLSEDDLPKLAEIARAHGVSLTMLGAAGGERLIIGDWLDLPISELARSWQGGLSSGGHDD